MAIQSGSSQTFLPAYQENYLKDLLANAAALGTQGGMEVPEYQIADMTPLQRQAIQMGASGLGAYAPFFQSAANQMGTGAQTLGTGLGTTIHLFPVSTSPTPMPVASMVRISRLERTNTPKTLFGPS